MNSEKIPLSGLPGVLSRWAASAALELDEMKLYIGVDVGGTNTRVVIGNVLTMEKISLESVQIASCRHLVKYLEQVGEAISGVGSGVRSAGACIAIAGRILDHGKRVEVTNYKQITGPEDQVLCTDELPEIAFPRGKGTMLVNDLEGSCFGVSSLVSLDTFHTRFSSFYKPPGCKRPEDSLAKLDLNGHYVVAAMGTGLGVGFLFSKTSRNPQSRSFHIIATEGGHAIASVPATASPYHDDDLSLLRYASEKLYAGAHGIEWEDVCSGRGLVLTYNWVCERAGVPAKDWSAHQISQASMAEGAERDAHAAKAMLFHYRFLFMAIQQLAIITQCSGVILAGDNQYNNHKFVVENLDVLRKTFEHHPHSKWLENTTIYLPKGIQNINIHGALHVAHTLATIGHL